MSEHDTETTGVKSDNDRKRALANTISNWVAQGYRVESQSDFFAVVVTGHRPNHILHLILTIVTFGVWGIVWIGLALFGGEKRRSLTVDEYGNVMAARL